MPPIEEKPLTQDALKTPSPIGQEPIAPDSPSKQVTKSEKPAAPDSPTEPSTPDSPTRMSAPVTSGSPAKLSSTAEESSTTEQPTKPALIANETAVADVEVGLSPSPRGSILLTLLYQFLGLAWLAPIVTVLVLNFEGYIAGASVMCGTENCRYNVWGNSTEAAELDSKDHNALGGLQVAAKALEVWFVFIVGCLIYDLTMVLAKRRDGIPLRLLSSHLNFGDLRTIFSISMWASPIPPSMSTSTSSKGTTADTAQKMRTRKLVLYSFIVLVVIICLIANLMGPATAVLLLPTLGWREFGMSQTKAFDKMPSAESPSNPEIIAGCTTSVSDRRTDPPTICRNSAGILDTLMGNIGPGVFPSTPTISNQGYLSYSYNVTQTSTIAEYLLVPNRQALMEVESDYWGWRIITQQKDYPSAVAEINEKKLAFDIPSSSKFKAMRNVLEVELHRQAPALKFTAQCGRGMSVIKISESKSVHCYRFPNPSFQFHGSADAKEPLPYPIVGGSSTMCIRTGSGWAEAYAQSAFSIGTSAAGETDAAPVTVDIYSSDRAIYLDAANNNCFDSKSSCNWDELFLRDIPADIASTSVNPLVLEFGISGDNMGWCRQFTHLRFPDYVLNTSPVKNPLSYVLLWDDDEANPADKPISIHPDWIIAAWATTKGGVVSGTRSSAMTFQTIMQGIKGGTEGNKDFYLVILVLYQYTITGRALSLINYLTKDADSSTSSPPENPVFKVGALTRVWGYGVESRTSKLGVSIAILGCVCVLLRTAVGLWARTVSRSVTDFLVVALKQPEPGFLKGAPEKPEHFRFEMRNEKGAEFEF